MSERLVTPVIMSGGSGTRLWPVSTARTPKQFHRLGGALTMIQETARRTAGVVGPEGQRVRFTAPVVICNVRHGELAAAQLAETGHPADAVVLEPVGRNTAAVAAVASAVVEQLHPGALALLLPADHLIADADAFRAAVAHAAPVAVERIVTFGIKADRPETGYGYIRSGAPLAEGVLAVAEFVEKPDLATAEGYLAAGDYWWNGGIFLFAPAVMLGELRAGRADIAEAALRALERAERDGGFVTLDRAAFAACPAESIDYAVMERTKLAAVAPTDAGWADVGSWSELHRLGEQDAAGNYVRGPTALVEVADSLVWTDGVPVGVLGVSGLVVVASQEGVLVLPRERAQDVKRLAEALAGAG